MCFFFCNEKTAYEMRISDWSSDVCSSDLRGDGHPYRRDPQPGLQPRLRSQLVQRRHHPGAVEAAVDRQIQAADQQGDPGPVSAGLDLQDDGRHGGAGRSEEHTSELQSLMRIAYAVFCLKKKKRKTQNTTKHNTNHTCPLR